MSEIKKANNRLEELLNKVGQTISDLPEYYNEENIKGAVEKVNEAGWTEAGYIMHLTDVIDRMETALNNEICWKDQSTKADRHMALCAMLNDIYRKKNADYGDSFHTSFVEEGMAMPRIRLGDKFNRFKNLSKNEACVLDESIVDTLLDLANYALMTVLEIEHHECNKCANCTCKEEKKE